MEAVQKTSWDEEDFKIWCEENGHDFEGWLWGVASHVAKKHGLYRVENLEDFEEVAQSLYHTYN